MKSQAMAALHRAAGVATWFAVVSAMGLAGCAGVSVPSAVAEAPPQSVSCPQGVPAGARCLRGQDSASSHYLIVMPEKWSGVLVVHAHGGPNLGAPTAARADEDIKRWAITVREGHAWAGSVFRQGGFAVTTAAGGAMVAARAAEMYPKSWEGILLTSGVVAGPATYDFRLDLRALYQHLCGNHPRQSEPAYPLSVGLPADSKMTNADLAARADECLGLRKPAAQRTSEQAQRIKTLVDVVRTPESSLMSHLNWGTFTLRDVVQKSGGAPFGNERVRYTGSTDDAALNAAVPRFKPDAQAQARFVADVDHAGRFKVPVLTTHGVGDSTVFVEGHDTLRQRMQAAGNGHRLVQTFVDSREHSYLGDATYPPLFESLLRWMEQGEKPTPASIAQRCRDLKPAQVAECRFLPDFTPRPLASRIPPR